MKKEDIISYYDVENSFVMDKGIYIAYIKDIYSKRDLMNIYYKELEFPKYFGFNWDALKDCLFNLEWIKENKIYLIHPVLPLLSQEEFVIYLEILFNVYVLWKKYPQEHQIKIYFNSKDKGYIESLLPIITVVDKN